MRRPTRRSFLEQAGIGASMIALAGSRRKTWAGADQSRPRAPFVTLYSNDTTNITSCISPYHDLGDPISDERLRASIDEARGVDVHMLQPGLGWIPWWQSEIYSADDQVDLSRLRITLK